MKTSSLRKLCAQRGDTSLLDVMAILAAVAVVTLLVLPMIAKSRATSTINCVNILKQTGLGFLVWAMDHGGKYPMQVSTNMGGTMELVPGGAVFPHYAVMSNELSTPKILLCPKDTRASGLKAATNFARLSDSSISYFVGLDAATNLSQMWLCGDRNLAANNNPIKPGLFVFKASKLLSWTAEMHNTRGNFCFADGSVQDVPNAGLQRSATNALRSYYQATTNTSFRLAIP